MTACSLRRLAVWPTTDCPPPPMAQAAATSRPAATRGPTTAGGTTCVHLMQRHRDCEQCNLSSFRQVQSTRELLKRKPVLALFVRKHTGLVWQTRSSFEPSICELAAKSHHATTRVMRSSFSSTAAALCHALKLFFDFGALCTSTRSVDTRAFLK